MTPSGSEGHAFGTLAEARSLINNMAHSVMYMPYESPAGSQSLELTHQASR